MSHCYVVPCCWCVCTECGAWLGVRCPISREVGTGFPVSGSSFVFTCVADVYGSLQEYAEVPICARVTGNSATALATFTACFWVPLSEVWKRRSGVVWRTSHPRTRVHHNNVTSTRILTAEPLTVWNHWTNMLWQDKWSGIRLLWKLVSAAVSGTRIPNMSSLRRICSFSCLISQVIWWGDHQCNLFKLTDII